MDYKKIYELPLSNGKVMKIKQGAFGSGEHETTKACLRHLQNLDLKNKTVLDVGCGTGILGIAACLLGASYAVGFDPSFSACKTARFCNALNKIENNYITCSYLNALGGEYDVVAANIYQDILLDICDDVTKMTKTDGYALLSGIPIEYNYEVKIRYERGGFKVLDLNIHDEYSTILFKKGG
jgi:ribosomal protein L11 methyltransferase